MPVQMHQIVSTKIAEESFIFNFFSYLPEANELTLAVQTSI